MASMLVDILEIDTIARSTLLLLGIFWVDAKQFSWVERALGSNNEGVG